MAMVEFSSNLVEEACEKRLESYKKQQTRIKEILDMSYHNYHIVGKLQQKLNDDVEKIIRLRRMCQYRHTILLDDSDYGLLETYL